MGLWGALRQEGALEFFLLCEYNLSAVARSLLRQRSFYPAMGVCAVGAWLVRCMWLGMLANKTSYKTTISNGERKATV